MLYGSYISKSSQKKQKYLFSIHTGKKILDEKCLFIAISFYRNIAILCVKMSLVYKTLGPRHTRYFCTQYWDKKILWYLRHRFQCPTKVSSENTYFDLFFVYIPRFIFVKSLPWSIDILGPKKYFYHNIFSLQTCVQKCLVWRGPYLQPTFLRTKKLRKTWKVLVQLYF